MFHLVWSPTIIFPLVFTNADTNFVAEFKHMVYRLW